MYIAAVMPDAQNSTYRYAMYKDKRHASDSSTKLYPHSTAHKGSGCCAAVWLFAWRVIQINTLTQ